MKTSILCRALIALIVATGTIANATPIIATAVLDSAQEQAAGVPSTSTAIGAAVLTVEPTTGEFDFSLEITGIDPSDLADLNLGPAISSIHLHEAPAGQNGPVRVDLGGGVDNTNVTSFGNGGLSLNTDGGFFGGIRGDTLTESNLNLAALFTDSLYINVHTNDFLGGAIRGQLNLVQQPVDPDSTVPEPTTLALGVLAALTVGTKGRRR